MAKSSYVRPLFILAGLYDGLLGVAFCFFAPSIYRTFDVTPPNHYGYVRFPGLLLVVFALMFFAIATEPRRHRNLIPFGILLKLSYCGLVGWYWLRDPGLPTMWKPFVVFDLLFLIGFIWAYRRISPVR